MADPNQILAERNAEVEQIRGFVDLTDEAKERRIAEVNEKANAEYAEAQERQKQAREERLRSTKKSLFAVNDDVNATAAERAQIHAAFRQATGDVFLATMDSGASPGGVQDELAHLLERAERTGDTLLAKAIFHEAVDRNLQPIIDSYLENRPNENRAWEKYTEALGESQQATSLEGLLSNALSQRVLHAG
jgi:hypothetical protein